MTRRIREQLGQVATSSPFSRSSCKSAGRAVRPRRLPGPWAAPPRSAPQPCPAAPHPRDEESVPAGARVAVGAGLLVVLEVLDLHLVVEHGHAAGERRSGAAADGKRRRLTGHEGGAARDGMRRRVGAVGSGPGIPDPREGRLGRRREWGDGRVRGGGLKGNAFEFSWLALPSRREPRTPLGSGGRATLCGRWRYRFQPWRLARRSLGLWGNGRALLRPCPCPCPFSLSLPCPLAVCFPFAPWPPQCRPAPAGHRLPPPLPRLILLLPALTVFPLVPRRGGNPCFLWLLLQEGLFV